VCYILDEPTIGLHHRDNRHPARRAGEARGQKATRLVVVEHDEDTIRRAHHVIDLGPSAGKLGGQVHRRGSCEDLVNQPQSVTGPSSKEPLRIRSSAPRRCKKDPSSKCKKRGLHNLKNIEARIRSAAGGGHGVSGIGQSTLARDVLYESLVEETPIGCKR